MPGKKNLHQQRKTENRIEKMHWEIMWRSARIDLTPVWDADLACWSCRFRTYLAWAGFCRRARRPHGSWRGGRPPIPAAATGRPGSAPRRATSRWSATRGCWAGAAPGNRAKGFLSREKRKRLRRVIVFRRLSWSTVETRRACEENEKVVIWHYAQTSPAVFHRVPWVERCSLNNTWIYGGPGNGPVQWGSQWHCCANFSSSCQNANYTLKQRSSKVLSTNWQSVAFH